MPSSDPITWYFDTMNRVADRIVRRFGTTQLYQRAQADMMRRLRPKVDPTGILSDEAIDRKLDGSNSLVLRSFVMSLARTAIGYGNKNSL